MLQTRNGWEEIARDDEPLRSYMAIFTPKGSDDWDEIAGLFPAINDVIKQFGLTSSVSVSLSAGVLSIVFHTRRPALPANFKDASTALTKLLTTQ